MKEEKQQTEMMAKRAQRIPEEQTPESKSCDPQMYCMINSQDLA
jgi:hypothetical protein